MLAFSAVGCGGQMHGLVVLDEEDRVIRPAILWNDGRTSEETEWLNTEIGKEKLSELTANIAFAGFTAPKLLWLQKHEPENFRRIKKIMLPKDYVDYRLTGVHASDYSDASGMLLLDVKRKCWSQEMLDICGVKEEQMPQLFESFEVIGNVQAFVTETLGLPLDCKVVSGAGDNAAAAVGPGCGGAMLAMVGCGQFKSVQDCANALVRVTGSIEPIPAVAARYEERYQKFRMLYPALKGVFPELR